MTDTLLLCRTQYEGKIVTVGGVANLTVSRQIPDIVGISKGEKCNSFQHVITDMVYYHREEKTYTGAGHPHRLHSLVTQVSRLRIFL